jgi:DNA-binding transcriptional LysR family regulator
MPGSLTVAFVPGVSPARWARVWRDRMPHTDLFLRAIGPGDVDAALAGEADMCFARLPVSEELNAIPLWTETAVVAAPKDSVMAELEELSEHDLVGQTVLGDGPVPDDVDATLDLVAAGVGLAVLPQALFRAATRRDLVARPLVDAVGTRIALVWRDADASELTEEFIGIVRGRTANSSRGRDTEEADAADARGDARTTSGGRAGAGPAGRAGGSGAAGKRGSGGKTNGRAAGGSGGRRGGPARGRPRRGR